MIKVTLVGTGTVSNHLLDVFSKADGVEVLQVSSRGAKLLKALKSVPSRDEEGSKTEQAAIYIIAVSDDAIASVSEHFIKSNALLVHTSGSVAMRALPKEVRRGVFYPLQTFSKGRKVDFKTVPICIEAAHKKDLGLLRTLASAISPSVYEISSKQRSALHLAAVFVNNFTNHMYQIGNDICLENEVPFEVLKPLLSETAHKMTTLSPAEAQTGPAKRNDDSTIEKHLNQLKNKTHKEVYSMLTKSIIETYKSKR